MQGEMNRTGHITGSINPAINTQGQVVGMRGFKGEQGDKGDTGEQGERGYGITSIVYNADYTLTITYADGETVTTDVLQGEKGDTGDKGDKGDTGSTGATGNGIASAVLNTDYTLTLTFTDGTTYTTPSIRGQKGETGDTGQQGEQGVQGETGNGISSITKTATVGKVDTYTITFTDGTTTTFDVKNGEDGQGSGDMLKSTYDTDNSGVVDSAESVAWSGVTGKPEDYPPSIHTHDDRYYTESEVDTALSGKANTSHTHTKSQITDFPSLLALGETSSTAYRGDRGKTAYDHSRTAHAPSNAEQNVQSNWTETDTSSDAYIKNKPSTFPPSSHTHDSRYYTEAEVDEKLVDAGKVTDVQLDGVSVVASKVANLVGLANKSYVDDAIPTELADLSADATHRLVTDTEKALWNSKADTTYVDNAIATAIGNAIGGEY